MEPGISQEYSHTLKMLNKSFVNEQQKLLTAVTESIDSTPWVTLFQEVSAHLSHHHPMGMAIGTAVYRGEKSPSVSMRREMSDLDQVTYAWLFLSCMFSAPLTT